MVKKQWIAGILSLMLLLTLGACGTTPAAAEEPQKPAQSQDQTEKSAEQNQPEGQETAAPASAVVPASDPVSAEWFSDAAFVGDSVSVMLETYNSTYEKLGTPAFFCSVSLSQNNALNYSAGDSRLPEYPKGSGQHPRIEDGIAASGAKKVYIMLGMNCIAGGVDSSCQDLVRLVDEIQAKSPDTAILIQSVTPMTTDSRRADQALNNDTIQEYNTKMEAICQEKHWYFINVAEAVSDQNGFLRADFSGDQAMGIHFNYNGAEAWTEYLLTHVPPALK